MPNLGVGELAIIFFIVLILFGARRLPEVGQGLGKAIRSFKDALTTPEPKELDAPGSDANAEKADAKREAAHR